MRYEGPRGRLGIESQFSNGFADGRFHHGFHVGPILFVVIAMILIILSLIFLKRIKKRKTSGNHLIMPIRIPDEPSIAYDRRSSQRAAILDQWERNILKEDH